MRVAIVSDIHGNRHAFEAVLDAVEASDAEELWCLGDLVGYGAEPDACVELARRHAAICARRQPRPRRARRHPLRPVLPRRRAGGPLDRRDDRPANARLPRRAGAAAARRGRRPVPRQPARPDLGVRALPPAGGAVHGRADAPRRVHRALPRRAVVLARETARRRPARPARREREIDARSGEWLLNPGSVGQPRDGDPRAAWLLLDTATWQAEFRRTAYDVAGAAAAIRAARLPDSLAERLAARSVASAARCASQFPSGALGCLAALLVACGSGGDKLLDRRRRAAACRTRSRPSSPPARAARARALGWRRSASPTASPS